jgi:2-oxoglutarate dehydrogenase complex dehydrogenase (E1) component-like enzyme
MDLTPEESKDVTTVVFLSGKLYYDLVKARKERKATGIAFVRLEVRPLVLYLITTVRDDFPRSPVLTV